MQEGIIFHTSNYASAAACEAAALAYEAQLDAAHNPPEPDWTCTYPNYVTPGAKFCVLIDGDDDVALAPPPSGTTREEVGDDWYPGPDWVVPPGAQGIIATDVEKTAQKSVLGKKDRKRPKKK